MKIIFDVTTKSMYTFYVDVTFWESLVVNLITVVLTRDRIDEVVWSFRQCGPFIQPHNNLLL